MIERLEEFIQPLRETIYKSHIEISSTCKNALNSYFCFLSEAESGLDKIGTMQTFTKNESNYKKIIYTENGPFSYSTKQASYYPQTRFDTYQGFLEITNNKGEIEKVFAEVTSPIYKKRYGGCKGYIIKENGEFQKITQLNTIKDPYYPDLDKQMKKEFSRLEASLANETQKDNELEK